MPRFLVCEFTFNDSELIAVLESQSISGRLSVVYVHVVSLKTTTGSRALCEAKKQTRQRVLCKQIYSDTLPALRAKTLFLTSFISDEFFWIDDYKIFFS